MSYLAQVRSDQFETFRDVQDALDSTDLLLSQVANMLRTASVMVDDSDFSADDRHAHLRGALALLTSAEPCFNTIRTFCGAGRNNARQSA